MKKSLLVVLEFLLLTSCTRNWPSQTVMPLPPPGVTYVTATIANLVETDTPIVSTTPLLSFESATLVAPTSTVVAIQPPVLATDRLVVTVIPPLLGSIKYGVHVLDPVSSSGLAASLGTSLVKIQVRWSQIQQCGFEPDWGVIGFQIDAIKAAGLEVVMSVVTTPPCLNSANKENFPPDDPQQYANFVGQLASMYHPYAIEVWNEENLDREWGVPDPANYIALLAATRHAIKENSPTTMVIAGALAPTWHNPPAHWDDLVFWQEFGQLGGYQLADCVGVHVNSLSFPPSYSLTNPYGGFDHHSWYFVDTVLGSVSATGLPACITEFGVATPGSVGSVPGGFGWAQNTSLEQQAEWLVEGIRLAERYGNIKMMIFWNLDFSPACGGCVDEKSPFSLLDKNGNPLPAYWAIKQALGH